MKDINKSTKFWDFSTHDDVFNDAKFTYSIFEQFDFQSDIVSITPIILEEPKIEMSYVPEFIEYETVNYDISLVPSIFYDSNRDKVLMEFINEIDKNKNMTIMKHKIENYYEIVDHHLNNQIRKDFIIEKYNSHEKIQNEINKSILDIKNIREKLKNGIENTSNHLILFEKMIKVKNIKNALYLMNKIQKINKIIKKIDESENFIKSFIKIELTLEELKSEQNILIFEEMSKKMKCYQEYYSKTSMHKFIDLIFGKETNMNEIVIIINNTISSNWISNTFEYIETEIHEILMSKCKKYNEEFGKIIDITRNEIHIDNKKCMIILCDFLSSFYKIGDCINSIKKGIYVKREDINELFKYIFNRIEKVCVEILENLNGFNSLKSILNLHHTMETFITIQQNNFDIEIIELKNTTKRILEIFINNIQIEYIEIITKITDEEKIEIVDVNDKIVESFKKINFEYENFVFISSSIKLYEIIFECIDLINKENNNTWIISNFIGIIMIVINTFNKKMKRLILGTEILKYKLIERITVRHLIINSEVLSLLLSFLIKIRDILNIQDEEMTKMIDCTINSLSIHISEVNNKILQIVDESINRFISHNWEIGIINIDDILKQFELTFNILISSTKRKEKVLELFNEVYLSYLNCFILNEENSKHKENILKMNKKFKEETKKFNQLLYY